MNEEKLSLPIQPASALMTLADQLLESWKDREYRTEFVRERVRSSVALQIRALREQRSAMTQKQLGDALGKAQTWISVLEDPEYGKMSVATLLSLAGAFDTDLEIKFRPFSMALLELIKQSSEYFEVRSFEEELEQGYFAATFNTSSASGQKKPSKGATNEARGISGYAMAGGTQQQVLSRAEHIAQQGHEPFLISDTERSLAATAGRAI